MPSARSVAKYVPHDIVVIGWKKKLLYVYTIVAMMSRKPCTAMTVVNTIQDLGGRVYNLTTVASVLYLLAHMDGTKRLYTITNASKSPRRIDRIYKYIGTVSLSNALNIIETYFVQSRSAREKYLNHNVESCSGETHINYNITPKQDTTMLVNTTPEVDESIHLSRSVIAYITKQQDPTVSIIACCLSRQWCSVANIAKTLVSSSLSFTYMDISSVRTTLIDLVGVSAFETYYGKKDTLIHAKYVDTPNPDLTVSELKDVVIAYRVYTQDIDNIVIDTDDTVIDIVDTDDTDVTIVDTVADAMDVVIDDNVVDDDVDTDDTVDAIEELKAVHTAELHLLQSRIDALVEQVNSTSSEVVPDADIETSIKTNTETSTESIDYWLKIAQLSEYAKHNKHITVTITIN